jgi:hypothetical protein
MSKTTMDDLLGHPLKVVNIGLEAFAEELAAEMTDHGGAEVVHVEWVPPAGGDPVLANLLSKLGT